MNEKPTGFARSTVVVLAASAVTMTANFISQMLIARFFGSGAETDAALTAQTVPLFLQAILLFGLPYSVTTLFLRAAKEHGEERAHALTNWILAIAVLLGVAIAMTIAAIPSQIIGWVAPELSQEKALLTAQMLTILTWTLPLTAIGTIAGAVKNTKGRFFLVAVTPGLGALANLAIVFFVQPNPLALAWGGLASALVQAAVLGSAYVRGRVFAFRPFPAHQLMILVREQLPLVLFGTLTKATPVIERYFASGLPNGQLSYIGYAGKVAAVSIGLIGGAIATPILPIMSQSFINDGVKGLASAFDRAWRTTLALTTPILVCATVFAIPIIQLLFERGQFSHVDTLSTAAIAAPVLMASLTGVLGALLGRALYVQGRTFSGSLVGALTSFVYPVVAYFGVRSAGYVGLAWSNAFAIFIGLAAIYLLLAKQVGFKPVQTVGRYLVIGSALSAPLLLFVRPGVAGFHPVAQVLLAFLVALPLYGAIVRFFDREMADQVMAFVRARSAALRRFL